jgi:hypothetical protein
VTKSLAKLYPGVMFKKIFKSWFGRLPSKVLKVTLEFFFLFMIICVRIEERTVTQKETKTL